MQHRVHLERAGVEAAVRTAGDRDDRAGLVPGELQTPNQGDSIRSIVAVEIDQGEAEASIRERFQGFVRGRDGSALVSADPEKSRKSELRRCVDFDHECSSLDHLAASVARTSLGHLGARQGQMAYQRDSERTRMTMLTIFHRNICRGPCN